MLRRWSLFLALVLVSLLVFSPPLVADVRLPAMFTDNAVLQRDIRVPVWGWAQPGEQVTVKIAAQTKTATPDAKTGKWTITLDPLPVGGPLALTVSGKNTITLQNVLVGEVWICSGQSNMQLAVHAVRGAIKKDSGLKESPTADGTELNEPKTGRWPLGGSGQWSIGR